MLFEHGGQTRSKTILVTVSVIEVYESDIGLVSQPSFFVRRIPLVKREPVAELV